MNIEMPNNLFLFPILASHRNIAKSADRSRRQQVVRYAMYAIGLPILLAVVAAAIDLDDQYVPEIYKPQIGVEKCFLRENRISGAIFFYIPIALICTCNSILFGWTTIEIFRIQKELANATGRHESYRHRKNLKNHKDK